MATVLTDISALQYYRTPPVAREIAMKIDAEMQTSAHLPGANRKNASQHLRALDAFCSTALIGVAAPYNILDNDCTLVCSKNVRLHASQFLRASEYRHIDGPLYVTSPEQTLLSLCRARDAVAIAKLICEFCGLYAIRPGKQELAELLARNMPAQQNRTVLGSYYRVNGRPRSFVQHDGVPYSWEPCIQRNGSASNLWKRPPLCKLEDLHAFADRMVGAPGIATLRKALRYATEGSGSPAETVAAILMGPDRRIGQEGLPEPTLNRQFALTGTARESLGQDICVVDISWRDHPGCCVEIDGAAFHDDSLIDPGKLRSINEDSARKAAIAHMGMEVVTLAWSQLHDLQRWDTAMDLVFRNLGLERKLPSPAFLKRRDALRQAVFAPGIT